MKVGTTSAPRLKYWLLLASLLVTISTARPGQAQVQSVGSIEVCYKCATDFGFGSSLNGPTFVIRNTSGSSITNGVLKIGPGGGFTDSFNVGTIAANSTFAVAPGISNDGGARHTFFGLTWSGGIRDTSEVGPNGNNTVFEFTGQQGSVKIDSGLFTPAATQGLSGSNINFLGGPGDNDDLCSNCFDHTVATLFLPFAFTVTVTHPLQQGLTNFDYATDLDRGGPTLKGALDYTNSGITVPGGILVRGTISLITDSGWGNQYDFLTVGTSFFGTKCLHQQIKVADSLIFACLVTLYQCQKNGVGSFSGTNCPVAATGGFIESTLEFENDLPSINGPGLIEGADNAQTCTNPPRPGCENLTNIFESIQIIGPIIVKGTGGHLSIFVPFSSPNP